MSGFTYGALAMVLLATAPAFAGDEKLARPIRVQAPLALPLSTERDLAAKARKRDRRPTNIERYDFLDLSPGLAPVTWPKPGDMRARLVTPEVRRTPVVGWIAENLYRSKKDTGWCLEVDPGEGEYVVFYRLNLH